MFLGLYDDSAHVAQYLGIAGIQVDETLRTPFTPDIDTDGTALILLHRARDRRVLVILGSSRLSLLDMVRQLDTGGYRSGLVSDFWEYTGASDRPLIEKMRVNSRLLWVLGLLLVPLLMAACDSSDSSPRLQEEPSATPDIGPALATLAAARETGTPTPTAGASRREGAACAVRQRPNRHR